MKKSLLFSAIVTSCLLALGQAKTYDFPRPVDTTTKTIEKQEKKVFQVTSSISADNMFKAARLNGIKVADDSALEIFISPENEPINPSPWFAFRLWTKQETENRKIRITYPEGVKHRYWPKHSHDGEEWTDMDSAFVAIAADTSFVEFNIEIPADTIWISAQPIVNSDDVADWCKNLAQLEHIKFSNAGKSTGKRKIPFMAITNGSVKGKNVIVCFSRQHPPEVTGYFALKSFIERVSDGSTLSKEFLNKYVVLVYPLLNPDGVDEGHWRHNLGGIDLNRDWAYYHQKETRTVADHVVKMVKKSKGMVELGLDFHSTYYDVYYTMDRDIDVINADFSDKWLDYIKSEVPNYDPHDAPSGVGAPVSKGWFVTQFKANGITYEIGDGTSPEFISRKSEAAADGMMKILLDK